MLLFFGIISSEEKKNKTPPVLGTFRKKNNYFFARYQECGSTLQLQGEPVVQWHMDSFLSRCPEK